MSLKCHLNAAVLSHSPAAAVGTVNYTSMEP